ncbi:ABC transporter permease [Lachnospiraceae bacterium 62-35]
MGDSIIWFLLSCKRQLRRPSFLAILAIIPILLFAVSSMGKKESQGLAIALYVEGMNPGKKVEKAAGEGHGESLEQKTAVALTELSGAFSFYICGTLEELKADVETGKAECGYVFPKDLRERLRENDFRRCITLYSSPATVLDFMSEEVVFSTLMEVYAPEILIDYSKEQGWDTKAVQELYEEYSSNGSTFSFQYESEGGGEAEENSLAMTFPVRGIGAVFLFVTGIFAVSSLAEDEKKGLFLCVPYEKKWWYTLLGTAAPVAMSAGVVVISLYLTGEALIGVGGMIKEIGYMGLYVGEIAVFSCLLKIIGRRAEALAGMVPFFMIGSLALCPVFVDVGKWLPQLRMAGRLFLPYYYLIFFIS